MDRVHYGQSLDAIPQRLKCCCANNAQKMQQNPSLLPPYIESSLQLSTIKASKARRMSSRITNKIVMRPRNHYIRCVDLESVFNFKA